MRMRAIIYRYSILIISLFLVLSCKLESNKLIKNSVWEKFKTGIGKKDYNYLIENSLDSIRCIDCIVGKNENWIASEVIFKNYSEKLYDSNLLDKNDYSIYKNDKTIRISYSFRKFSRSESTNIIYMFDKIDNRYLFTGMMTIP